MFSDLSSNRRAAHIESLAVSGCASKGHVSHCWGMQWFMALSAPLMQTVTCGQSEGSNLIQV